MTPAIALVHLLVLLIPASVAIWFDLSQMRLPNWLSLGVLAIFIVVAPLTLPLETIPWRLLTAGIVFCVGLLFYSIGWMGAGDVKFATVLFLFVMPADITLFIRILGIMALAGYLTCRIAGRIPSVRAMAPNWVSWTAEGKFSYGVALALALLYYLLLIALGG